MSKNILALYDTDGDYVMRFLEFAQSRSKNIPFEIRAYTKEKELSAFAAKNPVAILLIAEKLMTDDIRTLHTGCIILLTEGVSSEKYKMYPSVSRYRSASSLLKEVFDLYAKDGTEHKEFTAVKGDTKIIGIYSPVSGCLKTSFALTLGQLLSEKYPTICLNFEACAGFSELLHVTYERDIEDLIYYIRTGEANLTDKMNAMTERVGDLAYLPPARSVQDVLSTTIEEWMQLIDLVREKSGFERLIDRKSVV